MKSFLTLKSVDEVVSLVENSAPLPAESVPLDDCAGRYLAGDMFSPEDLPGFARSTVDGYAVRARDVFGAQEGSPALLEYVGDCPMGRAPNISLKEGQTARILTGGMLPEGADCVVMVEYSRPAGERLVELIRSQAPGDHVLERDEDASAGSVLLPAGTRLRPQEIGLLAALGQCSVPVARRPRVSILSTGDEVVPFTQKPAPGQVRDVNSHSLAALCRNAGAEVRMEGLVRDDVEALEAAVRDALSRADVVLLSGGSSAGMRDHTVDIFRSMPGGEILAHGVAISPGKPFILARSGAVWLMGLPGHVSSALVCARVFLLPLLRRLQGGRENVEPCVTAVLSRAVASAQGRRDYIRVRLSRTERGWEADPVTAPSGLISGLVSADALVICPENSEGLYAGQEVSAFLLE
ncbi:gephyrin-like molybdotransferase Glp [Mailhella massiliensis]|uniref:Molybdopterin molybdenumtransferase n=1 Tax=Mailhella massiliensis TaxID=1903261 RepID=A0A921AVM6_9BACT|nr:gephyrin-like molybdotransferase Glp [Mailhella massiliensis]HJD96583.1 molybdopterin molybdotransferase MoeA [Mailhella massiliensis]